MVVAVASVVIFIQDSGEGVVMVVKIAMMAFTVITVVVSIAIVNIFIQDGGQGAVMVMVAVAIIMVIGGGTSGVVMFVGTEVVVVAKIAEVMVTTIVTVFV